MIALASVDLPEPLGPMSAWTSPRSTVRSSPRRISLSPARTCRLRISRSAMGLLGSVAGGAVAERRRRHGGEAGGLDARRGAAGEGDELGQRRVGELLHDAAVHPQPQQAGGAAAASSATCEHRTRPSCVSSTKHDMGATTPSSARIDLVHADGRPGRAPGGSRRGRRGCSRRAAPSSAARRCARGRRAAGPPPARWPSATPGRPPWWRPSSTSSRTPYSAFVVKIMPLILPARSENRPGPPRVESPWRRPVTRLECRASPVPLPAGGRGPRQRGERANCRRRRPVP